MSQLIWQIVRNNSSFLLRQKANNTTFSTEASNVTSENRFRTSGLVRNNTVTVVRDADAQEGSVYPLRVVSGLAGTSRARSAKLTGSKKGKKGVRGYKFNAQRINEAAAISGTRDGLRRAALARWSKLAVANKKVRAARERSGR